LNLSHWRGRDEADGVDGEAEAGRPDFSDSNGPISKAGSLHPDCAERYFGTSGLQILWYLHEPRAKRCGRESQ